MKAVCRLVLLCFAASTLAPVYAQTFVNFEAKQTALTPEMERLAARGTVFTKAYCQ